MGEGRRPPPVWGWLEHLRKAPYCAGPVAAGIPLISGAVRCGGAAITSILAALLVEPLPPKVAVESAAEDAMASSSHELRLITYQVVGMGSYC